MAAEQQPVPMVVIACQVLEGILDRMLPPEVRARLTFLDSGLHATPKKLGRMVQASIDAIPQPSLVVLGYGLCGNGLRGIAARQHVLLMPRAHDCIAMFMGSRERYRQEFAAAPGTYYLTKGWLDSGSNPLDEYEKYVPQYGAETALWLMDQQYQHYRRLVLVAHSRADLERYRPRAQDVASFCERWGMAYDEILGSDIYLRGLVEAAAAIDQAGEDFIVVPPGGLIAEDLFQ